MKKITLSLAILATVYAAVSCADQNRQEPHAAERTARIGDDGDDEPGSGADRCAAMDVLKRNLGEDPSLKGRMDRIEEQTNRFVARALAAQKGEGGASVAAAFNGVLTIPVVVNVVYRTTQQNISQAQIQSQIDVLNQDFRKINPAVAQTPGVYQPRTADFEIQFTLAAINRRASSRTSWGTNDWVKSARRGGIDPMNPAQNLNIWICNIGNTPTTPACSPTGRKHGRGSCSPPAGREPRSRKISDVHVRKPSPVGGFFLPLLPLIFLVMHLAAEPPTSFELTMQTRGTTKSLTVTAEYTEVRINEEIRRVKTPPTRWKRLLRYLDGLRLADLPKLKATSPRSAVDAAYQAQLRVTRGGKTFSTEPFGYPNAPKPLASLLNPLVETGPQPERTEF